MAEKIIIVGTGFGGLGMAIHLKKAGIHSFEILEKGDDVGGVWRENTYPGAACDVPSHSYSFSFEINPNWSRAYSPQPEILDYLRHCARKYDLLRHIRFGAEVETARFDDEAQRWLVKTTDGKERTADVFIAACGQLSQPIIPELPGRKSFGGEQFHSARWNHDYDLTGKRVAVIGTGASAIQFIPEIAPKVERLTVFQRSANYIVPKPDREYSEFEQFLYGFAPVTHNADRLRQHALHELGGLMFSGSRRPFIAKNGRRLRGAVLAKCREHLNEQIPDEALRKKLTPDYPLGCKRLLISDVYYPTFLRKNVELVTTPIKKIDKGGILTADDEHHEADAIIYGTGFASTEFITCMDVRGRGGRSLTEEWKSGPEAFLGMSVSGYPNLFVLYGPNTNSSHVSIIYYLEAQMRYVTQAVQAMRRRNLRSVDVKREVQRRFNEEIQGELENTVWNRNCNSWYKHESGKITNNWPGFAGAYALKTRRFDLRNYDTVPAR